MGSILELFEATRRDHRLEGCSLRELARRHGCHRKAVLQTLESALPPKQEPRRWRARKIDPAKTFIDAMLREDLNAPRKQQHTARRVLGGLVDEHGLTDLTYSTVRDSRRPARPGDGPPVPLIGAGPADQPPGPGGAAGE
jgi:transposase